MATRQFAAWVGPFAERYRESGAEAVRLARSLSDDELKKPTGNTSWFVRDELVHMAASGGDFLTTLGSVLRGDNVDTSVFADIDARNARNLEARRDRSMDEVASELENNDTALQNLLTQLTLEDEARKPAGMPFPLNQLLNGYAQHDPYHLGQIRDALGRRAEEAAAS